MCSTKHEEILARIRETQGDRGARLDLLQEEFGHEGTEATVNALIDAGKIYEPILGRFKVVA